MQTGGSQHVLFISFSGSPVSVRWWRCRTAAPTLRALNRRKEQVRTDELIRHGEETLPRRSEFTDW